MLFTENFILIFIITILLLAMDFYYLKNIAGRRLVGLRWWNEVVPGTGASHWVFESAPPHDEASGGVGKIVTPTDRRFFWLGLYVQPAFWIALAVLALVRLKFIWLTLVGEWDLDIILGWEGGGERKRRLADKHCVCVAVIALVLTITNTLAFSRCDKFSQASGLVERGLFTGSLARNVGGAMVSRLFRSRG
jgi:hypothetical protein